MKDLDSRKESSLGRRMFFKIENLKGRDKCCICKATTGEMVKHMATGLTMCPTCLRELKTAADIPEVAAPMHQPLLLKDLGHPMN